MGARILIVDDELSMREFLAILLEREGHEVSVSENAARALELIGAEEFDLIISDVNMPGLDGISLLKRVKEIAGDTVVLMITAFSTAEQAVEAMKHGAYDYIAKPFKVEEIKLLVRNALERTVLGRENRRLKEEVRKQSQFCDLIGKSKQMQAVYDLVDKVAPSMASVMICGESGTGKELAARAIHCRSPRSGGPFVAINCGAIPETLMESELFGHCKGAFTGALADKPGLFEQADGGTILLDEIGELPVGLQTKLLRVLQEREVRRVGGTGNRKVDVRVVAASNRDLREEVTNGAFREDLFFRLNVIEVRMPALRERPEDIPFLIEHFFRKFSGRRPAGTVLAQDALGLLLDYPFPGNVRELENMVERCIVLGNQMITVDCLPLGVREQAGYKHSEDALLTTLPAAGMDLQAYLDAIEKGYLLQALAQCGGVKKRAAELLGLSFRSFRYRLAKFGMECDDR